MLIQLTQRQPGGGAGTPLLLNPDHVMRVEPASGGATVIDARGTRFDVLETHDVIMDRVDDARDEGARRKARDQRQKDRHEREAAEKKRLADDAQARAKSEAAMHEAESQRHQKAALASAENAKRLAREAGLPERQVTSNVTPEGVDLKHPAPQPHEGAPAGAAHDPAASQARADPAKEQREGAEAEAARTQEPEGAPNPRATHDEGARKREEPKPLAQQRREAQQKDAGKHGGK